MTIRYECEECQSVLKIRNELAGTEGKCPKCKAMFTVPTSTESAASKPDAAVADEPDPVDMPREVTPEPDFSSLQTEPDPQQTAAAATASEAELKPSIAELMREHEEKKKKKKSRTDKERKTLKDAALAAEAMTAGTAADALTRNYDQKRQQAGEAPPMTREERREAENRAAMLAYVKRIAPIAVGLLVCVWLFISWWLADPIPELGYVSGVITKNGSPVANLEVLFAPYDDPLKPSPEIDKEEAQLRISSTGLTNENGEYVLMYNPDYEGAVLGDHKVTISDGAFVFSLEMSEQVKTVVDGDNKFDFNLQ